MSFEEWFEDNKCDDLIDNKSIIKESYEAGAQSRQDEVDELQKRIDDALKVLNDASPTMLDKKAIKILKGKKDE